MDIQILNVYIPPVSACKAGYSASIQPLLSVENRIIASDFNVHHNSWHSNFADELENSDFNVNNGAFQTRVTANCSSLPDLTIVSHDRLASQVKTALNSDHLPIITTV